MQDANWNATAVCNTAGAVQERYSYTAYGTPSFLDASFGSRASSSCVWETLYAGYLWEAATTLFHVRHRVYHSKLGQWTQRDPLGMIGGANLYEYVRSRPLQAVDALGLIDEVECHEAFSACMDEWAQIVVDCFGCYMFDLGVLVACLILVALGCLLATIAWPICFGLGALICTALTGGAAIIINSYCMAALDLKAQICADQLEFCLSKIEG